MGYIEDIKKINALAKELLQHNIVQSQDEAVAKAREMLVKKDSSPATTKEYIDLSQNAIPQQEVKEAAKSEEWKEAMTRNNEYIVNELKKYRNDIDSFASQLAALRNELAQFKNVVQVRKEPVMQTVQTVENGQSQTPAQPKAEEKKEEVNHPRSGSYKPNDVAIEKFFYFGNKR